MLANEKVSFLSKTVVKDGFVCVYFRHEK